MNAFTFHPVHISRVRAGDVIQHEGKEVTVSASNITYSEFMGIAIFGDCYRLGTKPVMKGIYNNPLTQKEKTQ